MAQPTQTHINAFYADLLVAKQEAAVAEQKVAQIEDQIKGRGHPLPNKDGSIPEPETEDTASSNDVSAVEANKPKTSSKPIKKQSRPEANETAKAVGVKDPEMLDTKQDVKNKIEGLSAESNIKNTDAKK